MGTFGRIKSISGVIKGHAGNRYVQGRAAQLAGGALVADGLLGLENPLDGRKKRLGIFGSVVFIVIAVAMIFLASSIADGLEPYEGGLLADGVVTQVTGSSSSNDDGTCYVVVEYLVDGQTYSVRSGYGSTSLCDDMGKTYQVSYLPDNPAGGRMVASGGDAIFQKMITWLPWLMLIIGVYTFLIRAASIAGGTYLLLWGKKQVKTHPPVDVRNLEEELMAAWGTSKKPLWSFGGNAQPVAGSLGSLGGLVSQSPSPQPAAPPPGWYQDPDGQGQRWWDGTQWTEHAQN
jgi:hypothetical protein